MMRKTMMRFDSVRSTPSRGLLTIHQDERFASEEPDELVKIVQGTINDLGPKSRGIYERAKDSVRDETLFYSPFPDAARTIDLCNSEWMQAQVDLLTDARISLTPLGLYLVPVVVYMPSIALC
jgi:hypothetical protein